jgi:MATE family multidrug resistance protein
VRSYTSALRGAGDTRWVMWVSVVLHWLYAGAAIVLINHLRIPPLSMWLVFIGFILVLGRPWPAATSGESG